MAANISLKAGDLCDITSRVIASKTGLLTCVGPGKKNVSRSNQISQFERMTPAVSCGSA
jgi:hypothetical protein